MSEIIRNDSYINLIIEQLKTAWLSNPNLRLGELIDNTINNNVQTKLSDIEDTVLVQEIFDYTGRIPKID